MNRIPPSLRAAVAGLGLGFLLTRMGFADIAEVHRMFLLDDPRLILTFGGAVVLAGVGFRWLPRAGELPTNAMHTGIVPGSLLFGLGWVLCGACPGIVFVQLGTGQPEALLTLAGMVAGCRLQGRLAQGSELPAPVSACSG